GIRERNVTGVQTCALPIWGTPGRTEFRPARSTPWREYPMRRFIYLALSMAMALLLVTLPVRVAQAATNVLTTGSAGGAAVATGDIGRAPRREGPIPCRADR